MLPLEPRPDYLGESGMDPEIRVAPVEENSVLDTSLNEVFFVLH